MIATPMPLFGLTVSDAWLQYASVEHTAGSALPRSVVLLDASAVAKTAAAELARGVRGMLQENLHDVPSAAHLFENDAIVLGTAAEVSSRFPGLPTRSTGPDGFWLGEQHLHGHAYLIIAGGNERGILYGAFGLLRRVAQGQSTANLDDLENPSASIRWADQWDNLDDTIERGYAGRSIFFAGGKVRADLTRVSKYARLLASVGINGCNVNNVNADSRTLTADFQPQLARIADALRPWGVRLALSVSIGSPKIIGGLDTFDPLDPRVIAWWRDKADEIYKVIPDFAGFTIKADSEGQPGPSSFGRTPADAANSIARALAPHGGVLLYRTFVYNHHLDWRDAKNDRARSAYDIFHPLDGKFDDNVVLQIKHGPIDFHLLPRAHVEAGARP
jgi:alpha-glucuronidase